MSRKNFCRFPRQKLGFEKLESRWMLAGLLDAVSSDGIPLSAASEAERRVIYREDFESGNGGYFANNTGGNLPGLWHYSTGRSLDGLPNHSPNHSWYYGDLEDAFGGGQYATYDTHQGTLTSAAVPLPTGCSSELSFNYFLQTRPFLTMDFVEVYVLDGSSRTLVMSRAAGDLVQTGNSWQTARADLAAFAGKTVRFEFEFNTGPAIAIDPEGWYIDDIMVTSCHSVDLVAEKTVNVPKPNENQLLTYTITVTNSAASTSPATNVIARDTLPPGLTFVSSVPAPDPASPPGSPVWTFPEIPIGQSVTITMVTRVDAGTCGDELTNNVRVTATETDPNPENNRAAVTVVVNCVDLYVEKLVSDTTPNEHDQLTYTIIVTNSATSNAPATNILVEDFFPPGLTFIHAEPGILPGYPRWVIPILPPGESYTIVLVAYVDAGTCGDELINNVRVTATETDPDPDNNRATSSVIVNCVDVSIGKLVDVVNPGIGDQIEYSITVTNSISSNVAATNVIVRDQLPPGLILVSPPVTEWLIPTLEPGESRVFQVVAIIADNTCGMTLSNLATVSADETDPDGSNNTDSVTIFVICPTVVDLRLQKTSDKLTPEVGDIVTFTLTALNAGHDADPSRSGAATDIALVDRLPLGLKFESASDGGIYDPVTREIYWSIPSLEVGSSVDRTIVVTVKSGTAGTAMMNTAEVNAEEFDPVPVNNQSSVILTITGSVQFITPLSVFRNGQFVLPESSQVAILGRIWHDENGNGLWDAGEFGMDGVNVVLSDSDGTLLTAQSRSVDLDGDGMIDPVTETGIYWFQQRGDIPLETLTLHVELPNGQLASFPAASLTQTIELTVANPRLHGRALQAEAPNFGVSIDFVNSPSATSGTIIGYSWNDLNIDGIWGVDERGRYGFGFFLDINNDELFDPEAGEPVAFTGEDGKFVFANVLPGTYQIRELPSENGDSRTTFPLNAFHNVTVERSQVLSGKEREATEPNFGVFQYGVFVRPADQLYDRLKLEPLPQYAESLNASLIPWQSFEITNSTDSEMTLTGIIKQIEGEGEKFITVKRIDDMGTLVDDVSNLRIAANSSMRFMAFYDPANRQAGVVDNQIPDWLDSEFLQLTSLETYDPLDPLGLLRPSRPHAFTITDRLVVRTSTGIEFIIKLIGGSTFDSDVSYDGDVNQTDIGLLDELLSNVRVIPVRSDSKNFDLTMDINARCPNGAEGIVNSCAFTLGEAPVREISLGDFGPLNVELHHAMLLRETGFLIEDEVRMLFWEPIVQHATNLREAAMLRGRDSVSVLPITISAEGESASSADGIDVCYPVPTYRDVPGSLNIDASEDQSLLNLPATPLAQHSTQAAWSGIDEENRRIGGVSTYDDYFLELSRNGESVIF